MIFQSETFHFYIGHRQQITIFLKNAFNFCNNAKEDTTNVPEAVWKTYSPQSQKKETISKKWVF